MQKIRFILNGREIVEDGVSPTTTLLNYVRDRGLTGTKEGCAEGDCGACTVAIIDPLAKGGPKLRAVNSCLVLLPMVQGREVFTVEALRDGDGAYHPVQESLVQHLGSQCGYCTPGVVMSMLEACYRDDLDEDWKLDDQMAGNLCRCTGYRPIRDAARAIAGERPEDHLKEALDSAEARPMDLGYHKDDQRYFNPGSLDTLWDVLDYYPDARFVVGGTDLSLEVTKQFKRLPLLVSLEGIDALRDIYDAGDHWHVGATTPLSEVEALLAEDFPAVERMLRFYGARQIKNRGTVGGNLCTASPIGDMAPVLLSLGAELVLLSKDATRTIPVDAFFTGYRQTALADKEILSAVKIPKVPEGDVRSGAYKVSKRQELDISTVSAGLYVQLDEGGDVTHARFAFGGMAATPKRAKAAEAFITGKPWTEANAARAAERLAEDFTPIDDHRGSAWYRGTVAKNLLIGFFLETEREPTPRLPYRPTATVILDEVPSVSDATHARSPLHHESLHESGYLHASGEALYVDDLPRPRNLLVGYVVTSPVARGRIRSIDGLEAARAHPGVGCVITAADVPGYNDISPFSHDEPLLSDGELHCVGQAVAVVFADTLEICRDAAAHIELDIEELDPILTIPAAIEAQSFIGEPHVMQRGDVEAALEAAPVRITDTLDTGGQDHFYLESHCAMSLPDEDGTLLVHSSTQHPAEVQAKCAEVLGVPRSQVVVQSRRMGGGFGGKETQGAYFAAYAALGSHHTGRPCKVWLNRDQDMTQTGKRHPFHSRFDAGFDREGNLLALEVHTYSDAGWSADSSGAILDRCLFHLDSAYYIPALRFEGRTCRTNVVSNTAFRGFGGPQGVCVVEEAINRAAERLGLDPAEVRRKNYYGAAPRHMTPYYQEVVPDDNRLARLHQELIAASEYEARKDAIDAFNADSRWVKRGIGYQPVKFGISFTASHLNQAGAFLNVYIDGTVQLNHGGTEMGQGLHTKMLAVCAHELGVTIDQIRQMPTQTDKVPNTSATAASSGSDLNGMAVQQAAHIIKERLRPVAAELLALDPEDADDVRFVGGLVFPRDEPDRAVPFKDVTFAAYMKQISLSAVGFYRTPDIGYDPKVGRGKPFHYFAYGGAVTEVEVNGLTGEHRVTRVDVLHDVGHSLVPSIDIGQIEGGYIQGLGWLTCEELVWSDAGHLRTHSPDTYKVPAYGEAPLDFRVGLLDRAPQHNTIHGSKAVGEPPFMLAIGAVTALRHAIAAWGPAGVEVELGIPATGEAILKAIAYARELREAPEVLPGGGGVDGGSYA